MCRSLFLTMVSLCYCFPLLADIEILYFTKPNELILESATLYNRVKKEETNKKEAPVYETVYAFCGEIVEDCNRETAKKIIKVIDHEKYIERIAKETGVRAQFMKNGKQGQALFEKHHKLAKDQGNQEYLRNLETQKREIVKNQEIFPFLEDGIDKKISSGTEAFNRALMPLEAEPMFAGDKKTNNNSHFELLSGVTWRVGREKEVTYGGAQEICRGMEASLPSTRDLERTKKWLAVSPVAKWVKSFWMDNISGNMEEKSVKVPYDAYSTINKIQQTYKIQMPYIEFKGEELLSKTEFYTADFGFKGEQQIRQQPTISDYISRLDVKKAVVCVQQNRK